MKRNSLTGAALVVGAVTTMLILSGCHVGGGYNLPPAQRLMEPGPGVGGPGPGVLPGPNPPVAQASAIQTLYPDGDPTGCLPGVAGIDPSASAVPRAQVLFAQPEGLHVQWDVTGAGNFESVPLVTPGRQDFTLGGVYRLKLTYIEGREGVELYPTIELAPPSFRSAAFLAHNAIPIQFNEEDFDQAMAGNFVTKVIYLPDPEYQELAVPGVQTLVSTRLEPGLDPIVEADRKGAILAVVRLGNKDMEVPGIEYSPAEAMPISYQTPLPPSESGPIQVADDPAAGGTNMAYGPSASMPAALIAGYNVPQYGMPISGTPIGLPGPPHVPLGAPAGLKKHVMRNWTRMHIPDPVQQVKVHVKQRPGLSYPDPATRVWITEDTIHPHVHYNDHRFGPVPTNQLHYDMGPGIPGGHSSSGIGY